MSDPYSHVSDPDRYAVLPRRARALIDRLETLFDVERRPGDDEWAWGGRPFDEIVQLVPRDGASKLTFGFHDDSFGLVVRLDNESRLYPDCGCDGCDDDAIEVFAELEHEVWRLTRGWSRRASQVATSTSTAFYSTTDVTPRVVLKRWVEAINAGDREGVRRVLAPSTAWTVNGRPLSGGHAVVDWILGHNEADPAALVADFVHEAYDSVAARLVKHGDAANGTWAVFLEVEYGRIRGGTVVEASS